MTGGGLKEGQLAIIAGRTGSGKTVLGMNILTHVAKAGTPVVAFSLGRNGNERGD
jgi:KaiC/GvpD/RAD55 family RecA-like ATPase